MRYSLGSLERVEFVKKNVTRNEIRHDPLPLPPRDRSSIGRKKHQSVTETFFENDLRSV